MTTLTIRQKLSDYLQVADDKKIRAIYTILEDDINEGGHINIEQYNKEIDEAMEEVKRGEVFTHEEVIKISKNY
jgi:predicted transcriptional regulator